MNSAQQELERIEENIKSRQHILDNQTAYHLDDVRMAEDDIISLNQRKSDILLGLEAGKQEIEKLKRLINCTKDHPEIEPQTCCYQGDTITLEAYEETQVKPTQEQFKAVADKARKEVFESEVFGCPKCNIPMKHLKEIHTFECQKCKYREWYPYRIFDDETYIKIGMNKVFDELNSIFPTMNVPVDIALIYLDYKQKRAKLLGEKE